MCGQVGRAVRERVRAAIGVEKRVDPDLMDACQPNSPSQISIFLQRLRNSTSYSPDLEPDE